jgi:hypothetical protein
MSAQFTKKKIIFTILSAIITFFLLFYLIDHVERIAAGNYNNRIVIETVFFSLCLFAIPLIGFRRQRTPPNRPDPTQNPGFQIRLVKRIRLDTNFEAKSSAICPICHFENPAGGKICLNCGRRI